MSEKNTEIVQSMKNGLDSAEINYEFDEDDDVFRFGRSLERNFFIVKYLALARNSDFIVRSTSPLTCGVDDKEMTREMAKLLAMINGSLPRGNFEIDVKDGELSFRHCEECIGLDEPPKDFILSAVALHQAAWERFLPCIASMFGGKRKAEDALKLQIPLAEPNDQIAFA